MPSLLDEEFGAIQLVRSPKASHIRIRLATDGTLRASLPMYAPTILVKRLIKSSREEIRDMLEAHRGASMFVGDMPIGKSHVLVVRSTSGNPSVARHGSQIIVSLPEGVRIESPGVQAMIRPAVIEALKKEAKKYLPKRLAFLAAQHGFTYQKVRFSHAAGRWGSCSSQGTIRLNIALMKLPLHLIDYVLIHELSHTKELNHSSAFWELVERCDPKYKQNKKEMKQHTPAV